MPRWQHPSLHSQRLGHSSHCHYYRVECQCRGPCESPAAHPAPCAGHWDMPQLQQPAWNVACLTEEGRVQGISSIHHVLIHEAGVQEAPLAPLLGSQWLQDRAPLWQCKQMKVSSQKPSVFAALRVSQIFPLQSQAARIKSQSASTAPCVGRNWQKMLPSAPQKLHWTMAMLVSMTSEFIWSHTHKPIPKFCPGLLRSMRIAGEVSLPLSNGTQK